MARRRAASLTAMGSRGMFAGLQQQKLSAHLRQQHARPKPALAHEPLHLNRAGLPPPDPVVGRRGPLKAPTPEVFTEEEREVLTEWVPVVSSRMRQIRYDHGNGHVHVVFRTGTPWVYEDVPYDVYQEFLNADSKGKFINHTLNSYPYREGNF